jgi:hypothetical protein
MLLVVTGIVFTVNSFFGSYFLSVNVRYNTKILVLCPYFTYFTSFSVPFQMLVICELYLESLYKIRFLQKIISLHKH